MGHIRPRPRSTGFQASSTAPAKPFHPVRLGALLEESFEGVLRAKGFLWLSSRHDECGLFSIAGNTLSIEPGGRWMATIPAEEVLDDEEVDEYVVRTWHPEWGDRRQEIVFIGIEMRRLTIEASLDACLLTEDEMVSGPANWLGYHDPFPAWDYIDAPDAIVL